MAESVNDVGALNRAISEQFGERLAANASAFGLALDEQSLVHGGSGRGGAAFIAAADLARTTPEALAGGVVLGLVAVDRAAEPEFMTPNRLANGVFAIRNTIGADGADGTSVLLDADGRAVARASLRALATRERFAEPAVQHEDVVVGEVGGVTISVGWVHVCFEWDDPPGSGGICHHTCYGW